MAKLALSCHHGQHLPLILGGERINQRCRNVAPCKWQSRRQEIAFRPQSSLNFSSSSKDINRVAKLSAYSSSRGKKQDVRISSKINPRGLFTFSHQFSTDIPLYETPEVSIDEYLQNRSRIIGALFPDQRKRMKLSDEEWSIQLLPIQFLFLSASPVVVMHLASKSDSKEFPRTVPRRTTSILEMKATEFRLHGLDSSSMPSHLALTMQGILYPHREDRRSLKGHVQMSIGFDLPPALMLVPEGIIKGMGEAVLKQLAEQLTQDMTTGLAADFRKFRTEKFTKKSST